MPKTASKPVKPSNAIDIGAELLASVQEMKVGARARVHHPEIQEFVRARLSSGLSQSDFAALLGVSVRTLQDWEQGRRKPSGAAMTLYKIAERRPEVLRELAA
ncbi:MAG: helix-turn-helix domain-containing protein [Methylocystis sp.]|uniref:helix-turn-helix domain-containing protein n=1 Tax=Methylocystis sp. TaxID=1911079 RepID=UPI003D1252EC